MRISADIVITVLLRNTCTFLRACTPKRNKDNTHPLSYFAPPIPPPYQPAIVASTNILESIYNTAHSILGEEAARNLTAVLSHAHKNIQSFFLPPTAIPEEEPYTWQETIYEYISDFIATRTTLENTSLLLALSTFLFLLLRKITMSWTSRLGNLGRFSPFTRSPTSHDGRSTKVSDSDFSYITADDLRRHQQESVTDGQHQSTSPVDYGPPRDTDMLILKNKKREFPVHFPAYSIPKGELTIGQVREAAAKKTASADPKQIKLLYKGKNLKDDRRTAKQEGLRDGSEVMCTIAESPLAEVDGSDSGSEEESVADGAQGDDSAKKRRNRGRKSRRRNAREARDNPASGTATPELRSNNLNVPSQTTSRTTSPKPPASGLTSPATPLDKLNALHATLVNFKPEVDRFMKDPPLDPAKRKFEYSKWSETIMAQVMLKLDAVETEGDNDARMRRKELVRETQAVLSQLDMMKQ